MNISLFKHRSRAQVLQCLWSMSKGSDMSQDPHFLSFETDALKVELLESSEKDVNFFGDGEVFHQSCRSWDIKILPKSLLVYCMEKESSFLSYCSQVTLTQ